MLGAPTPDSIFWPKNHVSNVINRQRDHLSTLTAPRSTMPSLERVKRAVDEARIQPALIAYKSKQCAPLRGVVKAFEIPYSAIMAGMAGRKSCSSAHEEQQNCLAGRSKSGTMDHTSYTLDF